MNAEIISSYSEKYILDWKQYISRARQAAAEGCVLLAMIITRFLSKKERKSPYSDVSSFITTKAGLDREAR